MTNEKFSRSNWLVLILFGLLGQLAWSVENMYFNLFVFETIAENLDAITLMVQLSGITATVVTLIAGVFSDKIGNRRSLISFGYIIWGVTVGMFGFMSPENTEALLSVGRGGVPIIATAHAEDLSEALGRRSVKLLCENGYLDLFIRLRREGNKFSFVREA